MNVVAASAPAEIKTLTGLRGFAAMIVMVSHSANLGFLPAVLGQGFGQVGVMLFFVLSGFLMTYLYLPREFHRETVVSYSLARIGRVFPLYYFLVVASILASVLLSAETFYPYLFDFKESILTLALVKAPYVFWTIPVEIHFYFVFVLFWYVCRTSSQWLGVLLLVALSTIPLVSIYLFRGAFPDFLTTYMFSFVLGVFIALTQSAIFSKRAVRRLLSWVALPFFVLTLLNLPALRQAYFPSEASFFIRAWLDPFTWGILIMLVLCSINESSSLAFLRSRVAVYIGQISFGIYLYHGPVIFYFAHASDINTRFKFLLSVLVTCLVATISFYILEKPASNSIRGLKTRILGS